MSSVDTNQPSATDTLPINAGAFVVKRDNRAAGIMMVTAVFYCTGTPVRWFIDAQDIYGQFHDGPLEDFIVVHHQTGTA